MKIIYAIAASTTRSTTNSCGSVDLEGEVERTPSIVAADRIARALRITLAEMFAELEVGA